MERQISAGTLHLLSGTVTNHSHPTCYCQDRQNSDVDAYISFIPSSADGQ
jgi:hypothetical protein